MAGCARTWIRSPCGLNKLSSSAGCRPARSMTAWWLSWMPMPNRRSGAELRAAGRPNGPRSPRAMSLASGHPAREGARSYVLRGSPSGWSPLRFRRSRCPRNGAGPSVGGHHDDVASRVFDLRVDGALDPERRQATFQFRLRSRGLRMRTQIVAEQQCVALVCSADDTHVNVRCSAGPG